MKPLIRPALPLLIAAALAACGKEEAKPAALSCQAPEAIGQLTDQIQAAVSPVQESGLPYFESGASEVQAAFGQLGFEITDIRTTQAASEGSKTLSCEATLRLAPKPEAQTRIKQSIENYLEINETDGIDYNGLMSAGDMLKPDGKGGFIAPFSYTVSQTDNGDKLVVNVASKEIAAGLLYPAAFYLAAPDLAKQVAEIRRQAASEETRQQAINFVDHTRLQTRIDLLRAENKQAQENLNNAWQALPAAARTALKDSQEQWARLRTSQCARQSTSGSAEPLEQEALRLECENREIQQRIPSLKQEAENQAANQIAEAGNRSRAAVQELQSVWQSVSDDVKDIIGQDFQSWKRSASAKCTAAAQQAGGGTAGQLAEQECIATEARAKAKELRGYVSQ